MTREYSIRTKTWMTNDGRCLSIQEITEDHLRNIRAMLINDLPPGYDQKAGRQIASAWMTRHESLLDYLDDTCAELDREAYAAAWIQMIEDELTQRAPLGATAQNQA